MPITEFVITSDHLILLRAADWDNEGVLAIGISTLSLSPGTYLKTGNEWALKTGADQG